MLGLLWPGPGRRVRTEKMALAGLRVLCAHVPQTKRGLAGACRTLAKAGVRRVLIHRSLAGAALSYGLVPVDPGPLYRHMAHRLVLAHLMRSGLAPERAVIELRGEGVSDELYRAAVQLCPRVAQVRICAGPGSDRLRARLFRDFGMAAELSAPADLVLQLDGVDGGEGLYLGPCLRTDGLQLARAGGDAEPNEVDAECLLCAQWQAGQVSEHNILIVY